jgi:hypothetical protein
VILGPNPSTQQLASFAYWLYRHAAHVHSISISLRDLAYNEKTVHGLPWQRYLDAAGQVLLLAMRAVSGAPLHPALPTLRVSPEQQQRLQRAWRLASFSSDLPGAAGLLPFLPAHSLTHLTLDLQHDTAVDGAALSGALAHLSSLQFLCLHSHCMEKTAVPASCLAGIAQLGQLTELQLHKCLSDIDQPLPLRKLVLHVRSDLPHLNLAHLTQLEVLEHSWGALTPQSVLPQRLQRLQLGVVECADDLVVPMQLPALQWLSILVRGPEPAQQLLQLAQHTALQELQLRYDGSDEAVATAAVWQQLPQLRELSMVWGNSFPSRQQGADILAGIAACTGLTKLVFPAQVLTEGDEDEEHVPPSYEPPPAEVAVCASLAGLTNLRHLELDCAHTRLAPGDALALTALTNLTHLVSSGMPQLFGGRGVTGAAVAAVACSLKQLRHLELDGCNMQDVGSCGSCRPAAAADAAAVAGCWRVDVAGLTTAVTLPTPAAADSSNEQGGARSVVAEVRGAA